MAVMGKIREFFGCREREMTLPFATERDSGFVWRRWWSVREGVIAGEEGKRKEGDVFACWADLNSPQVASVRLTNRLCCKRLTSRQ